MMEENKAVLKKPISLSSYMALSSVNINLGRYMGTPAGLEQPFVLPSQELCNHMVVAGMPLSGKSTTIRTILAQARVPFLVFEDFKREYRQFSVRGQALRVYTAGDESVSPLKLNPFEIPDELDFEETFDNITNSFIRGFNLDDDQASILNNAIRSAYIDCGWNIETGTSPADLRLPTMRDVSACIARTLSKSYSSLNALLFKGQTMYLGKRSQMYNKEASFNIEELVSKPTVIEYNRIPNDLVKNTLTALILGKILKYFEQKAPLGDGRPKLSYIIVIENAHKLFMEGANQTSLASNYLEDIIARLSYYGVGVIFSTNQPSKLSKYVFGQSNIKLGHRLTTNNEIEAFSDGTFGIDTNLIKSLPYGKALVCMASLSQAAHVEIVLPVTAKLSRVKISNDKIQNDSGTFKPLPKPAILGKVVAGFEESYPGFLAEFGEKVFLNILLDALDAEKIWSNSLEIITQKLSVEDFPVNVTNIGELAANIVSKSYIDAVKAKSYINVEEKLKLIGIWESAITFDTRTAKSKINSSQCQIIRTTLDVMLRNKPHGSLESTATNFRDSTDLPMTVNVVALPWAEKLYKQYEETIQGLIQTDFLSAASLVCQFMKRIILTNFAKCHVDFGWSLIIGILKLCNYTSLANGLNKSFSSELQRLMMSESGYKLVSANNLNLRKDLKSEEFRDYTIFTKRNIDLDFCDAIGMKNLDRMLRGLAPLDPETSVVVETYVINTKDTHDVDGIKPQFDQSFKIRQIKSFYWKFKAVELSTNGRMR